MHATKRTYLMNFWREKGELIDNEMTFLNNEIWKFRSLLVRGWQFWIGSHVIVRPDGIIGNDDYVSTWKTKIEDVFMHECKNIWKFFLLVDFLSNDCRERIPACLYYRKWVVFLGPCFFSLLHIYKSSSHCIYKILAYVHTISGIVR